MLSSRGKSRLTTTYKLFKNKHLKQPSGGQYRKHFQQYQLFVNATSVCESSSNNGGGGGGGLKQNNHLFVSNQ